MFILVSFHIKKEEEVICISVLFQLFVIDFKIGWVYSADFEINIMPVITALFKSILVKLLQILRSDKNCIYCEEGARFKDWNFKMISRYIIKSISFFQHDVYAFICEHECL